MTEDHLTCSDIGKHNLNNKNECRWAARNRRNRRSNAINWKDWNIAKSNAFNGAAFNGAFNGETRNEIGIPKGCSYDKVRKEYRWNKHPVGGRGSRAVCLRSCKYILINII